MTGGGGDVLALPPPVEDLLVHLPTLFVLNGLPGGGVLCGARPPGAGLGLLVRHHLRHLVHLSHALSTV